MTRAARTSRAVASPPPASGQRSADLARELRDRPAPPEEDPSELLPATERELADLRDTLVGRTLGIASALVSRDKRRTVFTLGKGSS